MKKLYIIATAFVLLPALAAAQVEKKVEVTKAYVPSVEAAAKLAIVPDMVDTVKLRPEIDYTITPLSFATGLQTRPIKPATVTYWQFNRPQTFYIKAGAGYPLNSVLDFYAATQNSGTGYALGYINHEGRYAKLPSLIGVKSNSTRMTNRIGAAAGKYFGPRTLEGELLYENRLYHHYGAISTFETVMPEVGAMSDYGDANLKIRFGDDFTDLSRFNFDVAVAGNMFWDHSDFKDYEQARQMGIEARVKLARAFGKHIVRFGAGYQHQAGAKALEDFRQNRFDVGARYGYQGGVVSFEAGADFCHDKIDMLDAGNYILPEAKVNINLGTNIIGVFAEIDSRVRDNSFRTLSQLNPYVAKYAPDDSAYAPYDPNQKWFKPLKSTIDYNVRFGVFGSIARERLTYRLYAGYTRTDNQVYWYNRMNTELNGDVQILNGYFVPAQAQQTCFSVNVEGDWRPASTLRLSLGLHVNHYTDEQAMAIGEERYRLGNGRPVFEGDLGVHYDLRKVSFGLSLRTQGKRSWSSLASYQESLVASPVFYMESFDAPFAADLGVTIDWRVSRSLTLFAEGRNLANQRLYEYAWYPEYGANCTVGIKANF